MARRTCSYVDESIRVRSGEVSKNKICEIEREKDSNFCLMHKYVDKHAKSFHPKRRPKGKGRFGTNTTNNMEDKQSFRRDRK